ncbi:MAG: beta-propeller domain-containing protein [Oscillospiraceae bacterium]|nr:beta-propeller domain-containing protein [Oscillospiraceae bacterium]
MIKLKKKITSAFLASIMALTMLSFPASAEASITHERLAGEFAAAKSYGEIYERMTSSAIAPCAKCHTPIWSDEKHYVRNNVYTCEKCGPCEVLTKCQFCLKNIYELQKFSATKIYLTYSGSQKISQITGFISCEDCKGKTIHSSINTKYYVLWYGETVEASAPDNDDYADNISETNVQVEGIEEGDIVKTDGNNIYVASEENSAVYVIGTDNGKMEIIHTYKRENAKPAELLLYDGKLIVIWKERGEERHVVHTGIFSKEYSMGYTGERENRAYVGNYGRDYQHETIAEVYETKNLKEIKASYSQKGNYISSRMVGSNIYLTTTHAPDLPNFFTAEDTDKYIPSYTVNGKTQLVKAADIIIPKNIDVIRYTIVGGLDVNSPSLFVSNQLVLGKADITYVSKENIYVAGISTVRNSYTRFTDIAKFNYGRGLIKFHSAGRVHGWVLNQMNMDEHKGYLRVASQIDDRNRKPSLEANLTILDLNMNTVSTITGIGETEKMRSSRFMGDIAYIVTFMMTDPLYSFDLSDPRNPKILDELKIPGYSSYMHSWDNESLLGVGFSANDWGRKTGVKLSMFDTKDNENLSERHVYTIDLEELGARGNIRSPIEDEHRSVIVSQSRNLIAFPFSYSYYEEGSDDSKYVTKYALFAYDSKTGFRPLGEIESERQSGSIGFERGVYIGDYIYAIGQEKIVSARISRFEVVGELVYEG